MLGVHFSAPDRATVDALHAQAKALGAKVGRRRGRCEASAGGGYGFRVSTPEGHPICDLVRRRRHADGDRRPLAADQAHPCGAQQRRGARSRPRSSSTCSASSGATATFMMDFVRCCSDHHSVAFARGNGPSLNHMAYEMPNIDGLMRGAGRVRNSGYEIAVGRRPARPRQQRVLLFHRAERLRHRVHHRGRAGRRFLCRRTTRNGGRTQICSRAAGTWRARRPSSRARRCRASCRGREPALRAGDGPRAPALARPDRRSKSNSQAEIGGSPPQQRFLGRRRRLSEGWGPPQTARNSRTDEMIEQLRSASAPYCSCSRQNVARLLDLPKERSIGLLWGASGHTPTRSPTSEFDPYRTPTEARLPLLPAGEPPKASSLAFLCT